MDESWSHPSLLSVINVTRLISVPLLSSADIELLHDHDPPLGTFHPWSYVDILADVPGRAGSSPLICPSWVLLVWSRVGTRQSAHCGDSSISLPSKFGFSRDKLVHLAGEVCTSPHSGMPLFTSGVMRGISCSGGSVMDLAHLPQCMRGHHLWLDIPLHVACPPIDLWFVSPSDTSAPSLKQDPQVPMKWCWYVYCSTTSVITLPPWIGFGSPCMPLSDNPRGEWYIHWHACASVLLSWSGNRSQLALFSSPKHWVMWAIPSHSLSCRVVGLHQLWQWVGPVCLLIFTKFSSHPHNSLVYVFPLPIGLSMVGQSPNLPNPHEFAQLPNNVVCKVCSLITKELGQCSRGQVLPLVQDLQQS